MKNVFKYLLIVLVIANVVGCGGGGGGAGYAVTVSSRAYSGSTETITYSDGTTTTASAASTTSTWATDHVTKTTTYTFADGTTNVVVATVAGTASTPTYSGSTQTIVTTYGDGTTSTATNTSTGSAVTWGTDHVTKTTTYAFSNGGTNAVVSTQAATVSTATLTTSNYPSNWTTTGTVTAPSVSSVTYTYGDGYTNTTESGTSSLPFAQTTLVSQSITDPSAYVTSTTTTYNLIWGTPDKNGPGYANLFPSASTALTSPLSYMGRSVTSYTSTSNGPTLTQPATNVLAAWNAGWTGNGVNILIIDDYANITTCYDASTSNNCHGVITMMISDLTAPGATKYALAWTASSSAMTGTAKNASNVNLTSAVSVNVVNMSFAAATDSAAAVYVNTLKGTLSVANLTLTGAVITKSAGNNSGQDTYSYTGMNLVKALVNDSDTVSRLLIVGALNKDGSTSSTASIATYSNYAGATTAAQDRFVLANGNTPYANSSVAINGYTASAGVGTSYAAPRVAGYAAIVMQKFPNLDAVRTSSIILDTARYDTLTCYPSCSTSIYGKGEASLSRALAPVGYLR